MRDITYLDKIGFIFGLSLVILPLGTYSRTFPPIIVFLFALILFIWGFPKIASQSPLFITKKARTDDKKWDNVTTITIALFALFLFITTIKHPVFAPAASQDWFLHLKYILEIEQGHIPPIFYLMSEGYFASFMLTSSFGWIRPGIIITAALSPFLIYYLSSSLFEDRRIRFASVAFYCLMSPLYYHYAFSTGLLTNFYSAMLILFALGTIFHSKTWRKAVWMPILFMLGIVVPISHFTSPIFYLALFLSLPFLHGYYTRIAVFFVPLLSVLAFPYFLREVVSLTGLLTSSGDIYVGRLTDIVLWLGYASPFLALQSIVMQAPFLPFILLLSLAGSGIYLYTKRDKTFMVFIVWFASIWVLSIFFPLGWRAIYSSAIPLTMIFPVGLVSIIDLMKRHRTLKKWLTAGIVISTVMGGHVQYLLLDASISPLENYKVETQILDVIEYARINLKDRDKPIVISSDRRFTFLTAYGMGVTVDMMATPERLSSKYPSAYVIADRDLARMYVLSGLYREVYSNELAAILALK